MKGDKLEWIRLNGFMKFMEFGFEEKDKLEERKEGSLLKRAIYQFKRKMELDTNNNYT